MANNKSRHRKIIQKCRDILSGSHSCLSEVPIFREKAWRYLDLECGALNPEEWKDCVIEAEVNNSKLQRESNFKDGMFWKSKDPANREFFQIEDPSELQSQIDKLKKQPKPKPFHRPVRPGTRLRSFRSVM